MSAIEYYYYNAINLYFTANKSTVYTSYSTMMKYTSFYDRVSPVCIIRHVFLIPVRWRISQILLHM